MSPKATPAHLQALTATILRASPGHPHLCTGKFRFRAWAVSSVGSAYLPISVHDLWDVLVICRIRTALGQDVLPPAARKLQFSPRRPPGAHLGPAHRSSAKRFTTVRDFFFFFPVFHSRGHQDHLRKYQQICLDAYLGPSDVCRKRCRRMSKKVQHHLKKMPKRKNCRKCYEERKVEKKKKNEHPLWNLWRPPVLHENQKLLHRMARAVKQFSVCSIFDLCEKWLYADCIFFF